MRGYNENTNEGHAWIADGCYFCVNSEDETEIIDPYIHCDWGWGGSCNGYYTGSVFKANTSNFVTTNYFAVDTQNKTLITKPRL